MNRQNATMSGFTLLELLVAIGIASALASVAVPAFLSWLPTLRLSAASRQVAVDLDLARTKAVSQNTSFQVSFNGSSYLVQKCAGSCVNDSGNIALPEGITVSASGSPLFLPRGTSTASSIITLSNGAESRLIWVGLVGQVTIL